MKERATASRSGRLAFILQLSLKPLGSIKFLWAAVEDGRPPAHVAARPYPLIEVKPLTGGRISGRGDGGKSGRPPTRVAGSP